MNLTPLKPFGLRVEVASGTQFSDLNVTQLKAWVDEHRVVVLRGLTPIPPHELASQCRRLGPLQPWRFGAVHELKREENTENYLYTERAVPLHWDGAFANRVPHYLVFECIKSPPKGSGGETVFVDTVAALARADKGQMGRWARASVKYTTEKKAHYGGTFLSNVIANHPTLGCPVIRFAEPVNDLNPVAVEPQNVSKAEGSALLTELSATLSDPNVVLELPWEQGDFVIADNHALLHGRRGFYKDAPRHLYRVNVLDPENGWLPDLKAAWRIRRPEFFRAELPILLIPALLCAVSLESLFCWAFVEAAVLFFLLFNIGDMVNCWLDQKSDLHRKTHLSEAVDRLGPASIVVQIAASAIVAAGLALHLALSLNRNWLAPAGLVGAALGAAYTAPPLRLKSRGTLQLLAYIGLLFVGPMLLVAGIFLPIPSLSVVLAAITFGLMQTGVLLVNTAEDLDEDEREGVRTAAVALGSRTTIGLAAVLCTLGGFGFAGVVTGQVGWGWCFTLPLIAVIGWNGRWLVNLFLKMEGQPESARREAIRAEGKHVPRRIEAGAWMSLAATLAVTFVRWWS